MKEPFSRHFHRRKRKKGDTAQLVAQLAPLEEQSKRGAAETSQAGERRSITQEAGAIIVDYDSLNVAPDIVEGRHGKGVMGMEPVVIVILGVMLTFIAFIAWQISQMPAE